MATTGVFNGTNLLVKVIADGGTLATIGHTTSCSMSLTHDLPEATTKDSSGYAEFISGIRGGTISFEGLVAYDDSANAEDSCAVVSASPSLFITILIVEFTGPAPFPESSTGILSPSGKGTMASLPCISTL